MRGLLLLSVAAVTAPRLAINTVMARVVPGGWGYPAKLRAAIRKYEAVTPPEFRAKAETQVRNYRDYSEYTAHQRSKLDWIISTGGFGNAVIFGWRLVFFDHFRPLTGC